MISKSLVELKLMLDDDGLAGDRLEKAGETLEQQRQLYLMVERVLMELNERLSKLEGKE